MKIMLISIVCFVIICLIVYTYYGGFNELKIRLAEQGGEFAVYDSIVGDYRQSGTVMDSIYYSLISDYQIKTYKGYAQYFDNPKKVEKSKLRSEAGCIIEPNDVFYIKDSIIYNSKFLPKQRYMVTEFPFKGKISVLFSIMKVYPALNKFAASYGFDEEGAVIEIYDIPNKMILYRKEIVEK